MKDATWGNEDLLCHNQDSMKPNKYINNFFKKVYTCWVVFSGSSDGRVHLQCRGPKFHPWVKKMPWRRGWLPTLVFLPGRFHGQRSLAGYSPWGCKESDTTELLTHTHTHTHTRACTHKCWVDMTWDVLWYFPFAPQIFPLLCYMFQGFNLVWSALMDFLFLKFPIMFGQWNALAGDQSQGEEVGKSFYFTNSFLWGYHLKLKVIGPARQSSLLCLLCTQVLLAIFLVSSIPWGIVQSFLLSLPSAPTFVSGPFIILSTRY